MSLWTLVTRSLRCYWPTNLAVAAGVAVAVAALVGSLLVGDSVSGSLRRLALERLGRADFSLERDGFFRESLAADLARSSGISANVETSVFAILLDGSARLAEGGPPVPRVSVLGVADGFWPFAGMDAPVALTGREVAVNRWLAQDLGAKEGDAILVSVGRKGSAPLETIFGRHKLADTVRATRLIVKKIISENGPGAFTLRSDRPRPRNLYVPLPWLQERLGRPGRVNTVLLASKSAPADFQKKLDATLKSALTLPDYDLTLTPDADGNSLVLKSTQVVLPPPVLVALGYPPSGVKTFEDFEERASSKHDAAADSGLEPTIFSVYLANTMTSVGKGAKPVVLPYSIIEGCNYQGEHFLLPMDVKYPKVSGPAKTEEIELNQWAADDLSVTIGDNVSATFFVSNSKGELVTRTVEFQVQLVVPLLGPALDRSFVPDFEGMTETKRIADWNPPFPIDLKLIRPKDEAYWDKYRTTPKAFVALDVIRDLWLPEGLPDAGKTVVPWVTAVELTRPGSVTPPPPDPALFTKNLLNRLSPADAGFVFRPIRAEALAAANAPTDFATLFLSMSFFLVASAAGLIVLLLRLTVDRRASQIGILLATGFTQRTASRIIVREALLVAFGGLVLGLPLGVAYASAIVFALKTSWSGAVAEFPLSLFVSTRSLLIGGLAGLFVSVLAILFSVRVLRRAIPLALLGGWQALAADPDSIGTGRVAKVVALVALLAAAILLGVWWAFALVPAPAAFALAGALLLVGLLALFSRLLKSPFHVAQPPPAVNPPRPSSPLPPGEGQGLPAVALAKAGEGLLLSSSPSPASGGEGQGEGAARPHGVAQPPSPVISGTGIPACQPVSLSLSRLAFRSASRHATRSLLTVGLLASATLIIVTVAAFQKNLALEYPGPKDSGSGGFRFLARSDIPIYGDLGSDAGRLKIGLPAGVSAKLAAARIYSFRENSGADISCLNLQRPKTPRVLGVPREFVERGGFAFTAHEPLLPILSGEAANVWTLLETDSPEGAIPAFADADTAQWQMHVGLGDEVSVPAPSGGALKLRIVGLLRGSIFAGELLVSEDHFTHALGAGAGFRFFLAECPAADEPAVRAALLDGLADSGLDVRRTSDVLAAYAGVENAYLSAFETLGGLGLVLATFGIVAVLLRSVIERRSELAMMLALGFTRRRVTRMVLLENGCLLAAGLVIGSAAALLAAAPQLVSTVADVRWMSLAGTLGAALAVGVASCAVAARLSVHGRLVEALRGE